MFTKILKQILLVSLLFFSAGIIISALLALVPDIYVQDTILNRVINNFNTYITFDYNDIQFGNFSLWEVILSRSIVSLYIISTTVFLIFLTGIPFGYYISYKKHSSFIQIINKIVCALSSVPILIWALLFNYIFFSLFQKSPEYDTINNESTFWKYVIFLLPPFTVMIGDGILADVIRRMKEETDKILNEDYIKVLHARGLSTNKHVFHALLPVIGSVFSDKISYLIGGIVVVEYVYNWKGLGWGILNAITRAGTKNYDFVLGASMVLVAVILIVYLINEIITILSDPRLRDN